MKARRRLSNHDSYQKTRSNRVKSDTYTTVNNETINLASNNPEKDALNFKSVIFCLELRKSFNKMNLRYVKYSFYLMRSLFKETKVLSRRSSCSLQMDSIIQKKSMLKEISQAFQQEKIITQKKKFFYLCKTLLKVRIIKTKRIESVVRITRVFQKKLHIKFTEFRKKCSYSFNKWEELNLVTKKLEKLILRKICSKILCNFTKMTHFSLLNKPKQNLPIMKLQSKVNSKSPVCENSPSQTRFLFLEQTKNNSAGKTKTYQKALIRMRVLNRNHLIAKKRYFHYFLSYCKTSKLAEYRNKGGKLKKSLLRLFKNTFTSFLESVKYIETYKNNLKVLMQKLDITFSKISNINKANSLICLRQVKKKPMLGVKESKCLLNFTRILNMKVFKKYFLAFILIQGFKGRKKTLTPSQNKKQFRAMHTVLRIFESRKYKHLFSAFIELKRLSELNQTKMSFFMASTFLENTLSKIYTREDFNSKLLAFNILRSHTIKAQINLIRGSKLYFLLKHHYIRALALSFM